MVVLIKWYIDFVWVFFLVFFVIYLLMLVIYDVVNNYSLLYKVQGLNLVLWFYMLCVYLDVVLVNRDVWEEDLFGVNIKDGFIYV